MTNVHQIRQYMGGSQGSGGGSGPEDPDLEKRVDALEAGMKEVKESLKRLEFGFARIEDKFSYLATKEDLARSEQKVLNEITRVESKLGLETAEIRGKLSNIPNMLQLIVALIATWSTGAGIVFTLLRYSK